MAFSSSFVLEVTMLCTWRLLLFSNSLYHPLFYSKEESHHPMLKWIHMLAQCWLILLKWICSVQLRNLRNLEIALCILGILKSHTNLEIAQPISRLRNAFTQSIPKSIVQSRDSATIVVAQSRDCTVSLCNLEIGTQFQDSENAQRKLEIAQITKLRGTYTHVGTVLVDLSPPSPALS